MLPLQLPIEDPNRVKVTSNKISRRPSSFCSITYKMLFPQLLSFQSIPHSFAKTPGGWACADRKQTGGGGVTRRGGRLRRNSSTTDSRNGQLFSGEKFFPKASSTLFITARLRRRFLLRTRRKASQEPGGSFSCAFAAPASASGTASANLFSNSGSIAPTVLLKIKRLRMPRIASGVFEASTAIS